MIVDLIILKMGDDIMSYNGGVALAMKGKECVAIACDKRYGVQNRTIATNFTKIFQYGDHCFVSFCGLATDVSVFDLFSRSFCFFLF
jgi:20S proteasome subunit beta 3